MLEETLQEILQNWPLMVEIGLFSAIIIGAGLYVYATKRNWHHQAEINAETIKRIQKLIHTTFGHEMPKINEKLATLMAEYHANVWRDLQDRWEGMIKPGGFFEAVLQFGHIRIEATQHSHKPCAIAERLKEVLPIIERDASLPGLISQRLEQAQQARRKARELIPKLAPALEDVRRQIAAYGDGPDLDGHVRQVRSRISDIQIQSCRPPVDWPRLYADAENVENQLDHLALRVIASHIKIGSPHGR